MWLVLFGKHHLEPGVSRLSDVVKIPGVRTVQSRTNISSNKKQPRQKQKFLNQKNNANNQQSAQKNAVKMPVVCGKIHSVAPHGVKRMVRLVKQRNCLQMVQIRKMSN